MDATDAMDAGDPFAEAYRMSASKSNSDSNEQQRKGSGVAGARAPTLPPLPPSTGLEAFVNGSGSISMSGGGGGGGQGRGRGFSTGNRAGFEDFDWDGTDAVAGDAASGEYEDIAERERKEREDRSLVR